MAGPVSKSVKYQASKNQVSDISCQIPGLWQLSYCDPVLTICLPSELRWKTFAALYLPRRLEPRLLYIIQNGAPITTTHVLLFVCERDERIQPLLIWHENCKATVNCFLWIQNTDHRIVLEKHRQKPSKEPASRELQGSQHSRIIRQSRIHIR